MIPPQSTLVKHDNPVAITRTTDKKAAAKKGKPGPSTSGPVASPSRTGKLPPVDAKAAQQTEDALNAILPPREYTEKGQLWVQHVSSQPATRMDVANLQEQLNVKLQQRQARETGICPVRRELFSQCFDELIRQVTIECLERGLLLLRVRNEIRMTMAAYQTLYESSVAFGMRKALMAEQGKAESEERVKELLADKEKLEAEVNRLKARCDEIEQEGIEKRAVDERKHDEEIQFLKRTNAQLKSQLESILAPAKK